MTGKRRAVPLERDDGLRAAITVAGGEGPLARELGISVQALREWTKIPAHRILQVEHVTGIPRSILRPDLYKTGSEATMNLTRIIDLKERIATSETFPPAERDFILECISIAIGKVTGLAPSAGHTLVGNAVHNLGRGIMAACTCGWISGGHFSSMAASAAFREHQEQASSPPHPPGNCGRSICSICGGNKNAM